MAHAALGIESCHGLSPEILAARGADGDDGQRCIDLAQHGAGHFAALVDLDHHGIGLEALVERGGAGGPFGGPGTGQRGITKHMHQPVPGDAGHHQPAGIGVATRRGRRVDGHADAGQRRRLPGARGLQHVAGPERIGTLGDHLAIQFLPAKPRPAIGAGHGGEEGRGQIKGIVACPCPADSRVRIGQQGAQQRGWPGRGGGQAARLAAKPQPELQHVPSFAGITPLADLVAPGRLELGSAQALRIFGRKHLRDRAVGPGQPAVRGLPLRAVGLAVHTEQP